MVEDNIVRIINSAVYAMQMLPQHLTAERALETQIRDVNDRSILDLLLCVSLTKGVETDKPLLTLSPEGDLLSPLHFISRFFHPVQKVLKVLRLAGEDLIDLCA